MRIVPDTNIIVSGLLWRGSPRLINEALNKANPASVEGARLWAEYLVRRPAWNPVRTIAALAALAYFVLATRHTVQP